MTFDELKKLYGEDPVLLIMRGHRFVDKNILSLRDELSGQTIAHWQASCGYNFTDPEILELTDCDGKNTVHEVLNRVKEGEL